MNKQEQIEELHDFILNNLYKGSTHLLAEKLYNAGYGNVSEYSAEIRKEESKIDNSL